MQLLHAEANTQHHILAPTVETWVGGRPRNRVGLDDTRGTLRRTNLAPLTRQGHREQRQAQQGVDTGGAITGHNQSDRTLGRSHCGNAIRDCHGKTPCLSYCNLRAITTDKHPWAEPNPNRLGARRTNPNSVQKTNEPTTLGTRRQKMEGDNQEKKIYQPNIFSLVAGRGRA